MAFSLVVIVGSPKAKPASVSPKLSGMGKTGMASSPKARPENQRLVGGMSPSASRVIGSFFGVFLTMSASSGSICCLVKTSPPVPVGPVPVPAPPVPDWPAEFRPHPARPTATVVAASPPSRERRLSRELSGLVECWISFDGPLLRQMLGNVTSLQ